MDVNLSPTPVNPEHARLDRERTDRQRRLPGFDQDAVAAARVRGGGVPRRRRRHEYSASAAFWCTRCG